MSTVNHSINAEAPLVRPTVRRPVASGKPAEPSRKVVGSANTPAAGVASSDTVIVPPSPVSKSPSSSLGKWKLDMAQPKEPAFALATSVESEPGFSWGRNSLQRFAPSLISLIVHCCVVLALGVVTLTSPESRGALLSGVFSSEAPALAGEVTTELVSPDPVVAAPSLSGGGDGLNDALNGLSLATATSGGTGGVGGDVEDVLSGPFGRGAGSGPQELASIQGLGKSTNFYGLSAQGNRFVFVIDSSTSMWGARWIEVRKELIKTIRKLDKDQYFFVICFDVTSLSMFGAEAQQQDFASADEENFRKLEYWLSQHTLGAGTKATTSLSEALRLKPDAIFLLTDGEFQDNVLQMLRTNNRNKAKKRKITVNTIGFHSQMGAPVLSQIASENFGQFKYVAPPPNLLMLQQQPAGFRFGGRVYPPQTIEEITPRF